MFTDDLIARVARMVGSKGPSVQSADDVRKLLSDDAWVGNARLTRALQPGLTRLAARYFLNAKSGARPYDPVSRFHLGNGARIERINYLADTSANGLKQSFGLMVNYLYDPDTIETNVEAFSRDGAVVTSGAVRRAARD